MNRTRITAIVTLYNPDENVVENVRTFAAQTDRVLLCDNSSNDNAALFAGIDGAVYISYKKNLGLPGAFNAVLKDSAWEWTDDEFVLFFDQDSRIHEGFIDGLVRSYQTVEDAYPALGCFGPVFHNTSNGETEVPHLKTQLIGRNYRVKNIITSSMLVRYRNIRRVGFWNEDLFLDYADWDLCWRIERAGMLCVITEDEVLTHSVGTGETKIGPVSIRLGPAYREYYQTRDVYYLLHQDYVPLKMRIRLSMNLTIRPVIHYLFQDQKKERMAYIRRGRADYRRGVRGEMPAV